MTDLPLCRDALGPPHPEALVTTSNVTFSIPIERGHVYDLYYRVDGADAVQVEVPAGPLWRSTISLPVPAGHVVWWFVDRATIEGCPQQQSSLYAFDHVPGGTSRPRGAVR